MSGFVWSDFWRCVHVSGLEEDDVISILSDDPRTRSMVVINDGDCGNVWGETRRTGCPAHVTVWCHRYDARHVPEVLDRYAPPMVVSTDPNDWSEDADVITDTRETRVCVHNPEGTMR